MYHLYDELELFNSQIFSNFGWEREQIWLTWKGVSRSFPPSQIEPPTSWRNRKARSNSSSVLSSINRAPMSTQACFASFHLISSVIRTYFITVIRINFGFAYIHGTIHASTWTEIARFQEYWGHWKNDTILRILYLSKISIFFLKNGREVSSNHWHRV